MKILAFESSAKAASVAITDDGSFLAQSWQASGLTHSQTLLSMAEDMLKNLGIGISDLGGIAVAVGPGSFTGIRIGTAAAKGVAWGAELPVYPVSTLEAMAYHFSHRDDVVVCPVMDARRSQVYNAKFAFEGEKLIRLVPDRAISIDELITEAKNDEKSYLLLGDGAQLCYNYFLETKTPCLIAPKNLRLQSAWGVCMAAASVEPIRAEDVEPVYLRLSQAERERLERENRR